MAYNNTFSIKDYFDYNYGLGNQPKKYKLGRKNFIVLILFCWIWIPLYIIKTVKTNKKINEWKMAFEYRRNNWYKEYDKYLEKTVTALDLKKSALKKLNLVEDDPDLQTVKPIFLHGPKFDGYWRQASNGTYRTSKHEYTYIIFKQDQILFYIANIDLFEPTRKKESTLEFFYSDITSVNTTTISTKPKQANLENNKVYEGAPVRCI